MKKPDIGECIALALAAAFVWIPLSMASSLNFVPKPISNETQYAITQNEWQRIISGTHFTDWVLAFVGIGQLLLIGRQARISDRQNNIMAKQTLIQTETSRPHVFILGIDIKPDGGAWLTLGTIWKNSGLTPPIKLNTAMQIDWIIGSFIPEDFKYELRTSWTEDVPLGVGREVVVDRIMIQEDDLLSGNDMNRSWFIWGNANYTDNFSPGVIHRVEYCFRMRVQNGRPTFEESGPHNRTYDEKTYEYFAPK